MVKLLPFAIISLIVSSVSTYAAPPSWITSDNSPRYLGVLRSLYDEHTQCVAFFLISEEIYKLRNDTAERTRIIGEARKNLIVQTAELQEHLRIEHDTTVSRLTSSMNEQMKVMGAPINYPVLELRYKGLCTGLILNPAARLDQLQKSAQP